MYLIDIKISLSNTQSGVVVVYSITDALVLTKQVMKKRKIEKYVLEKRV